MLLYKVVQLPFREEFRSRLLKGTKTVTSRTRKYGNIGDRFEAFGEMFEIKDVTKATVGIVAKGWYLQEGFESPEDFLETWAQIHPRKPYDLTTEVYRHEFTKLFWEQTQKP